MNPLAEWCQRAAALYRAGLGSQTVYGQIGRPPHQGRDADMVTRCVTIAERAGCPMAEVLDCLGEAIARLEASRLEHLGIAAGPRAASRLMLWLPGFGLVLNAALGVDVVGVLFGTPLGWACLAGGAALVWAARRSIHRQLAQASAGDSVPGIELEALAALLAGGLGLERALAYWGERRADTQAVLDELMPLVRQSGIPPTVPLRAAAARLRANAHAEARAVSGKLAVGLTVPLALGVLPAFVLWSVVPTGAGIFRHTLPPAPPSLPAPVADLPGVR